MLRQRQPRMTNPQYLVWLRKQRCCCGCFQGPPCDAAHIRAGSAKYEKRHVGIGEKPDDMWAVPLKHSCHMLQHDYGSEVEWWTNVKQKDPFAEAVKHYRRFKREQRSK